MNKIFHSPTKLREKLGDPLRYAPRTQAIPFVLGQARRLRKRSINHSRSISQVGFGGVGRWCGLRGVLLEVVSAPSALVHVARTHDDVKRRARRAIPSKRALGRRDGNVTIQEPPRSRIARDGGSLVGRRILWRLVDGFTFHFRNADALPFVTT